MLIEHDPAAMATALATLLNHAMQIERERVFQAESHQRTADRQDYANGFKPKTLKTRAGEIDLRIPQTRVFPLEATSTQVSRAAAQLDKQLGAWRNRPIGEITYLVLDARYERVRHDGVIVPCALLTAICIRPDRKRSILGCSVKLVVSDDHAGLKSPRQTVMAGVPWQRCRFHAIQNAIAHVP